MVFFITWHHLFVLFKGLEFWISTLSNKICSFDEPTWKIDFYDNLSDVSNLYQISIYVVLSIYKFPLRFAQLKRVGKSKKNLYKFLIFLPPPTSFNLILCLQQTWCLLFYDVTFWICVLFPEVAKMFASNLYPKIKKTENFRPKGIFVLKGK